MVGALLVIGMTWILPGVAFGHIKIGHQTGLVQIPPLIGIVCHRGGFLRGRPHQH